MNNGTRIRTALAIAIAFYTAVLKTDVADFGNDIVNTIYQIVMKVATFVVIFLITYYNNDFTVEGETGTKITREMKALRDHVTETAEEPEDSYILDNDLEVEVESGATDGEE